MERTGEISAERLGPGLFDRGRQGQSRTRELQLSRGLSTVDTISVGGEIDVAVV